MRDFVWLVFVALRRWSLPKPCFLIVGASAQAMELILTGQRLGAAAQDERLARAASSAAPAADVSDAE